MQTVIRSSHVAFLDGWRGLAIALVLVDHFSSSPTTTNFGGMGVDVFFSLSGLLMANILYVQRIPLGRFYKRRISRVFPVFLLFAMSAFVGHWLLSDEFLGAEFLATVAFLRTYLPTHPHIWHSSVPIGHLWSLNVEEHCYLLMGALTLFGFARQREAAILLASSIFSVLIFVAYVRMPGLEPRWEFLGTEVAAVHVLASAGYFLVRHRFANLVQPWMPIASFAIAAMCYTKLMPWWSNVLLAPYFLAFTVNHLDRAPRAVVASLSFSGIRQLGIWSYSIYIWQQPFYLHLHRHQLPIGLALAGAVLAGLASFYLFENPVRNWLNKNW